MEEKDTILSERLSELISGYLTGALLPGQVEELESWINSSPENMEIFREVLNERELLLMGDQFGRLDIESDLMNARAVAGFEQTESENSKGKIKLWKYAAAAAVATIIFSAGLFIYKTQQKETAQNLTAANNITPGKQGATLTLASGKKIRLTDAANGELAKEAGVVISKSANGKLVYEISPLSPQVGSLPEGERNKTNTLSTAKGETYQLRLPDGSLVWLNAASSLTYSAALNERGVRRVKLDGEGYFEIAKDKAHPFIVESKGQEVEVLGTHFNINSYEDESSIKTTLLEGSVRINDKTVLKPDQQAINSKGDIKVIPVVGESYTDWISGEFYFDKEPLESVMRKIARWYDIEVEYHGSEKTTRTFSGTVSRYDNLSRMLALIHKSEGIDFKVEGRKVTVNR